MYLGYEPDINETENARETQVRSDTAEKNT